jgi:hypothetical protein
MRPITTEPNGGGCGSVVASRTLGAQERGRRPDTKVGLDGRRARRRYQGWSVTKHDDSGGGGVETEDEVAR